MERGRGGEVQRWRGVEVERCKDVELEASRRSGGVQALTGGSVAEARRRGGEGVEESAVRRVERSKAR